MGFSSVEFTFVLLAALWAGAMIGFALAGILGLNALARAASPAIAAAAQLAQASNDARNALVEDLELELEPAAASKTAPGSAPEAPAPLAEKHLGDRPATWREAEERRREAVLGPRGAVRRPPCQFCGRVRRLFGMDV